MSEYVHKSHNVTVLIYHLVFPEKYRRAIFDSKVDEKLRKIFLEIGTDQDHVRFLLQSVPMCSVKKIFQMLKSLTARELFRTCPETKKYLWGGEIWSDGYFASTVGKHGDEGVIRKYVKNQGKQYQLLYKSEQLALS